MAMTIDEARACAEAFQQRLAGLVACYRPEDFAAGVAADLTRVVGDVELTRWRPPHAVLYALEACCRHHRPGARIPRHGIRDILQAFEDYEDPAWGYALATGGPPLAYAMMARQQFYLQHASGATHLGRSLALFGPGRLARTEAALRASTGAGMRDWLNLGLLLYGMERSSRPLVFSADELSLPGIAPTVTERLLGLLAFTPSQVGAFFRDLRERHAIDGIYAPSVFRRRPLLSLPNGRYLLLHGNLLVSAVVEGLSRMLVEIAPTEFREEFGDVFSSYVGDTLSPLGTPFAGANALVALGAGVKTTDFVVATSSTVFTIEAKGVEYRNDLTTENAIRNDSSTARLAASLSQHLATARLIRSGALDPLLGPIAQLPIVAITVTLGELPAASTDWYHQRIVAPRATASTVREWPHFFDRRVEVMAISDLEDLVAHAGGQNLAGALASKATDEETRQMDWGVYLQRTLPRRLGTAKSRLAFERWVAEVTAGGQKP